ncbi:MAG: TonB-dependent receptor [Chitinophagaceae bacterium]|uniref:TonB-dependent receptor domain-containing protein n=1 Tax=unclassified Paraflavitalea TaxID=2798305 RepID=UPI003D329D30|nr:TonB-dependent receptor [Chitinophagaceae bacterium]
MKQPWTLLTALLLTLSAFSQEANKNYSIKGSVTEGKNPIDGATVSLLRIKDSSLVKIVISAKDGSFGFESLQQTSYFITVSAVGFESKMIKTDPLSTSYSIELEKKSGNLSAVTVVSRKPLVEQKIDRMVVNVEAATTNAGTTALEVLEKSPGISVDKDGNISLKGKQGVVVYIDGRPSYLSGSDLANLLKNMPSGQLEQIEIMTNPPAKYDAAGNSGVINIKTKKNKQMGYNGSISTGYTQGWNPRFNESLTFNYRKNKVNLFTNISYNRYVNVNKLSIQRRFYNGQTKEVVSNFDQVSRMKDVDNFTNAKIGLDYSISKKTTVGFVVSGFTSPSKFTNNSVVNIADNQMNPIGVTKAFTINNKKWQNITANINARHQFDTTGQEISFDADFLTYDARNTQELINAYYNPNGSVSSKADTLNGNLPQQIAIWSAKVDYILPLKKGAKIEAGLKSSFVNTDNNAIYDSVNNGVLVRDYNRSNHFVYTENINAAYINLSKPLSKKWTAQLGLRVENTNAKGDQKTTNIVFNRNYTQLFPTAFVQYTASEKHVFGVNYGRRINRPDYEAMNPFIMFLDRYTYEQGNPNLKPQFSHNIELSHTFKGFMTTTLNYSNTTDIITQVIEQNPDKNESAVRAANVASEKQFGISVAAGFPVTKWWNANLYGNLYNVKYAGIINNEFVTLEGTTALFNMSNQFKFAKTWGAELSGWFRTPGQESIFRIGSLGQLNAGISKQVMKGKGTLRLSVRDALRTQNAKGTSRYSTIDARFSQVRDTRVVSFNFTYRFAKGKAGAARVRNGASEEQSRVKGANSN